MTHPRRAAPARTLLIAVLFSGGCDHLLEVDVPDRVAATEIERAAHAELLVSSAVADFECAFTNYVAAAGLLGDELADGQLDPRLWDFDRRSVDSAGTPVYAVASCSDPYPGVYQTLQTARFAADNALRLLQSREFATTGLPRRQMLLATAAAYSGYGHLLLAEVMCTAAVDGGPRVTSAELFHMAEQRFTLAIDTASGLGSAGAEILSLARLGRARARLDLGRGQDAAADARLVPFGFRKDASYSSLSERSSNRIWRMNNRGFTVTIEDDFRMGHMGLPDPRLPVANAGRSAVNSAVPLWVQTKYPSADSPIPMARFVEAQLIIAEVEGGPAAVHIINQRHAEAGLPPFSAFDPDSILRHVIEERRVELFLESHHFFDKLRFNAMLEPDPLPDTPSPGTGFLNSGRLYGTSKCLPLPDVERLNNPNIP